MPLVILLPTPLAWVHVAQFAPLYPNPLLSKHIPVLRKKEAGRTAGAVMFEPSFSVSPTVLLTGRRALLLHHIQLAKRLYHRDFLSGLLYFPFCLVSFRDIQSNRNIWIYIGFKGPLSSSSFRSLRKYSWLCCQWQLRTFPMFFGS
jgi:hypothetical protein